VPFLKAGPVRTVRPHEDERRSTVRLEPASVLDIPTWQMENRGMNFDVKNRGPSREMVWVNPAPSVSQTGLDAGGEGQLRPLEDRAVHASRYYRREVETGGDLVDR